MSDRPAPKTRPTTAHLREDRSKDLLTRLNDKHALIGILGLGYVGLPLMLRFAEVDYRVLGLDIDQAIDHTVFIHDKALIDAGTTIGTRTRIWGFTRLLSGARIGADCNVCEQGIIENDVVVGDRVTIKSGVEIWDGLRLEDDAFVAPMSPSPMTVSHQSPPRVPRSVRHGRSSSVNCQMSADS